ncbi:uncharacterized protein LOC120906099 [Anopheles arabiensis]|uniref:uncharacterized protein LOC120906099 n=1 Tax=Anopheles arabiensis TaxID=7173 RepID=UPI001AAD4F1E|nr:uncharacterized protein LOC120906099 [Anopheles arabiensis]
MEESGAVKRKTNELRTTVRVKLDAASYKLLKSISSAKHPISEKVKILQHSDSMNLLNTGPSDTAQRKDVVRVEGEENGQTVAKRNDSDAPNTITPSPASAISKRKQVLKNGMNPQLYRTMMCQRFVSHIDAAALAVNGYNGFDAIFRQEKGTLYPTLANSSITHIQRKRITKNFRKRQLIGRFSPAFISKRRVELEKHRDLLRYLTANPLIEYSDGVIQLTAPDPIKIGSKVSVMLYTPRLSCCFGEVIDIEYREITMFKVRYEAEGIIQEQLVPDYCVALEEESEL